MPDTRWLTNDEMRLFRAFLAASSVIPSRLDTLLKATSGLGLDDYEVLVHLSEAPDRRLRMSELSDQLLHSRSRLTQRADRLVAKGLVTREKCDDDARGTWAVLTPEGMAELERTAPEHVEHVRSHIFDHLEPDQLANLAAILERLATGSRPT